VNRQISSEAVEWFALIERGGLRDPATSVRWSGWQAKVTNRLEYVYVMEMMELLRYLPPPTPVRRKDLLRDAARGDA
jgi:hypothetical protein